MFLNNGAKKKKSVILAGHSLGGTFVNNIAIEFPDSFKTAYAFSAAGVSKLANRRYQLLLPEQRANIINFDFEGDPIPSGGCCMIGRHFAIKAVSTIEPAHGFYETHVRSHLNRDFYMQEVDISKENSKFSRILCEGVRACIGRCLHFLLYACGKQYLPDWWNNRKIYKQRADLQRSLFRELQRNHKYG